MKKLVCLISVLILGVTLTQSLKAAVSVVTDFDSIATVDEPYSYQIQASADNGPAVFTLLEAPDGMTLSTSGLLEWLPTTMDEGGFVQFSVVDNDMMPNTKSFYIYVSSAIECNDSLISYWKLNEAGGGVYEDFANGHDASAVTMPVYDPNGRVDTCQRLIAPNNDYAFLQVSDDVYDFEGDQNFSIAFWFKNKPHYTTTDSTEVWFSKNDDGAANNWWWLGLKKDSLLVFSFEHSSGIFEVMDTLGTEIKGDTNWHHAAVAFHGSTTTVDGVRFSFDGNWGHYYQVGDFDVDFTGSAPFCIGHWTKYGPTNYYSATAVFDEIAFFRHNLTSDWVADLYSDGLAGKEICKTGNTAPLFKSTPVTYASEGSEYNYTVEYGEIDEDDIITLSDSILPSWLSFNPGTGLITGNPGNDNIGDTVVSIKMTDGKINIYQTYDLTIGNVNTPPDITSTAPTAINEDILYEYTVTVDDADIIHGDVITFSAPTLPSWLTINETTGLLSGTPTNAVLGTNATVDFDVVVDATDASSASDSQSFTITVTNINDDPVINGLTDPITIAINSEITLTTAHLDVTDVDNVYPDDFTLTVQSGLNYTIDGNTVTPSADFNGIIAVGIQLSDGTATVQYTVNITVGGDAVKDYEMTKVSIYPVPADNEVTFEMDADNINKIIIYNIQGKEVKSIAVNNENKTTIDVSDLESNIYLYKVIGKDKCASGLVTIDR